MEDCALIWRIAFYTAAACGLLSADTMTVDGVTATWGAEIGPHSGTITVNFDALVTAWDLNIQMPQMSLPPGASLPKILVEAQPVTWTGPYTAQSIGTAPPWSSQGIRQMLIDVEFNGVQDMPQFLNFRSLTDPPPPGGTSSTQADAPEPSTVLLSALGLLALGRGRRWLCRSSRPS